MTKRILSILLVLSLFCATFIVAAPTARAAEVLGSGRAGENITWTAYDDGRLVFSGTGRMDDGKNWLVQGWCDHGSVDVIFEEGITYVGDYTFYHSFRLKSIKTITIPTSLTEIGDKAFYGLVNLEKVFISDLKKWCSMTYADYNWSTPTEAGADLYLSGKKIVDLVIPDNITTLCSGAFRGCESLRTVTIPAHVTDIGKNAFGNCTNLEKVYFEGDPPAFGGTAVFYGCDTKAYYPSTNSAWNESVFSQNSEGVTWVPYTPTPFTDVPTSKYFYIPVLWAYENGITTGATPTTFAPNKDCTRGQIVTFLWRAAGEPEPTTTNNPFTDVDSDDYFYKAVLWAVEKGITNGATATTFNPKGSCTRAQVVTFMWRAAGEPTPTSANNPFVDVPEGKYYHDAVLWAVEQEITNGTSPTKFSPNNICNRGQIVTFLYRGYAD